MSDANTLPIRMAAARDHLPPATASGPPDCVRPYGNEQSNSRLTHAFPTGPWKIRWQADLPANGMFTALLHSGGRTLVTGRAQWVLFDERGRLLASQPTNGEDAEMDAARGVFYVANRYSNVAAYHLADGKPQYRFPAEGTADYARSFLHRMNETMTVASFKQTANPMVPTQPKVSALEMYEFPEPPAMDEDLLKSVHQKAIRHYEVPRLWTAIHAPLLVVAMTNAIEYLDANLAVRRRFEGAFQPQGFSLDEAGRAYLLALVEGKQVLWMLSPRAEAVAVPLDNAVYQRPPLIGYDHTVYLLGANQVTAITEAGKLAWQYSSSGRIAGAMVTANNLLLLAAGNAVVTLDDHGRPATQQEFPTESVALSPVLTAQGELLAVTNKHLYCLTNR